MSLFSSCLASPDPRWLLTHVHCTTSPLNADGGQQCDPADGEATRRDGGLSPKNNGGGRRAAPMPKAKRRDRYRRLLASLSAKHSSNANISSGLSGVETAGGAGAASAGETSPLVDATDSATVRPGMVLAAVAARGGQGVSQEAVDTLGMGVKEAIETLVRYYVKKLGRTACLVALWSFDYGQ